MAFRDRIVDFRRVRAGDLHPHPENFRRHPPAQRAALEAVLGEIGVADAIIIRDTPEGPQIIDGHLRSDLDPEAVLPAIVVDLDDAEARLLLSSLDPLAAMAKNDTDALALLLDGLTSDDRLAASVDALKRSDADLRRLFADRERSGADATPSQAEPRTEPGDFWALGDHRLLCGDSTDERTYDHLLAGATVDAVFTSLPYGVGIAYGPGQVDDLENVRRLLECLPKIWLSRLRSGGFAVVNFMDIGRQTDATGADGVCEYPMALEYWPAFRAADYALWSRRVWVKPNGRTLAPWTISSNRAAGDWEHVWTWKAPGEASRGRSPNSQNGWIDTSHEAGVEVGKDEHGAGMALGIAESMVQIHTDATVLDPFLGTGTTLIAAENLGRTCYGIELEPRTCDIAISRWENRTGREATRLEQM